MFVKFIQIINRNLKCNFVRFDVGLGLYEFIINATLNGSECDPRVFCNDSYIL